MSGHFIVLEGPDGAGTTLHSRLLAERLQKEGHEVLLTAEPTEGPIGSFIREQLKSPSVGARSIVLLPASSLQLLFTADRAEHLANVIEPALKKGKIVICDRYIPSTLIYGEALGLPVDWLKELNKNFIRPDVIILTLPSFEVCAKRLSQRTNQDTFEQEEFQKKIHAEYVAMAKDDPSIIVIDTSGEKQKVSDGIFKLFQRWLVGH